MGLFNKIFGRAPKQQQTSYTRYQLLNGYSESFTPFTGNAWQDSTVRAAVDSFARRAAEVAPRHIRRNDGKEISVNDNINRILQFQPNPYSSAYKFYYRLAANYKIYNNAFIYPVWDDFSGELRALYNINASDAELKEHNGEMYIQFRFSNGNIYTVPYSDVIHIGTHYLDNDVFGSSNSPLLPVLETAHAFNESMSAFAKLVAVIRGILKIRSSSVKEGDLNNKRDQFVKDNLRVESNGSGVIVVDNMQEYTPLTDKSSPIPDKQLEFVRKSIFEYYGTNESIVNNSETPDEASAFYDGELKPFFVQLSQALTNCLFTPKERGYGNEIVADINTLQYSKIGDKLASVQFLAEIGALELDEARVTLGFPPIGGEEGKRRIQTLNVVNAAKADQYQLGEGEKQTEETEENASQDT